MKNRFLKATGVYYKTTIENIKKSKSYLQPVFEALTNSLESIKEKNLDNQKLIISIHYSNDLTSSEIYSHLKIHDSGLGFNDEEFERFQTLNDNQKGYSNNGNGRIQYLHFFEYSKFTAVSKSKNSSTGYMQRKFILSKSKNYLNNNAIIKIESVEEVNTKDTYTEVLFDTVLNKDDQNKYTDLTIELLKKEIIEHYLDYLCENRDKLPQITIKKIINKTQDSELFIEASDIPILDREAIIPIKYTQYASNGKDIEKSNEYKDFKLKAYKLPENQLERNALRLTSKGQIVKGEIFKKVKLSNLKSKDVIDGSRYLFLLSSEYLNEKDTDTRGELDICTLDDFKKLSSSESTLDLHKEILLDDINDKANEKVESIYSEIKDEMEKQNIEIEKLKDMFLLNPETINSIKNKITLQDTEASILKKVYKADSEIIAKKDIEIKEQIDSLHSLDTSSDDYIENLNNMVNELVRVIPIQNRTALTHSVARRKIVLDLFEKILNKELKKQSKENRNIDEKLLHNLIFQQSSNKPDKSDLWLINEDYIYYKGTSENTLGDIKINGDSIIKDKLTEEEEVYRLKQQGDANQKRPDVMLFPNEGKCILIEFKAPNVNVSEHLTQLNRYASLINNLSKDKYKFTTYYGYLIGENIDVDDIIDNDSDFISAESLDYIFRPYKRIASKFDKHNGALYTEIIKYSTILERAKKRNEIFIDKLLSSRK